MEKSWKRFKEINRVEYDDRLVSLEQLEAWVRESGTWRETLAAPDSREQVNQEEKKN